METDPERHDPDGSRPTPLDESRHHVEWIREELAQHHLRRMAELARTFRGMARRVEAAGQVSSAPDALSRLAALAELDRAITDLIARTVPAARAHGASWTQIGESLGITKQAAHERYRPRSPARTPRSSRG